MNQRVAVRAIVRKQNKILYLRRSTGRRSIIGKFELPGGRLGYGEQPEDALRRYLQDDAGLSVKAADLNDVITYIDHDDRDVQYTVILYMVVLSGSDYNAKPGADHDMAIWRDDFEPLDNSMTDLSQLIIGIVNQQVVSPNSAVEAKDRLDAQKVVLFSDGGSRGNPGPSAAGYVIMDSRNQIIDQGGEYLGITTNNQAEYQAVRLGLERALKLGHRSVDARIDSMLVVNQMKGVYAIKNRELWPINDRIRELVGQFDKVTFTHIKREYNQLADGMVNKTLDMQASDSVA